MRLSKAVFHNIGPFDHAEIDIDSLGDDAKIVALCGHNGAGKTFSLQAAIAGAAYRKMPTQGTLVARAKARDSYIESHLVNGQRWVVRHDLDAVGRKGEAIVLGADGEPVYEGTSVKKFDAWAAKHFPPADVLYATSFAVQKSGGFIDLSSAERTSVILQVAGVARIERMALTAREEAKAARIAFEKAETRLSDERARGGDVAAIEAELVRCRGAAAAADDRLAEARATLDTARLEAARAADLAEKDVAVRARRAELGAALLAAEASKRDIEQRIARCQAEIGDADQIRAAGAKLTELDARTAELRVTVTQLEGQLATAEADHASAREILAGIRREKRDAEERGLRISERLLDESRVARAVADLAERRATVDAARAELSRVEHHRVSLSDKRMLGANDRIIYLRQGLGHIAAGEGDAKNIAAGRLSGDDDAVKLAAELPAQVAAATKEEAEAKQALAALEQELAGLERLAARAGEFAVARVELATTREAATEAAEREADADARAKAAHEACEPLRARIGAARRDLEGELAERAPLAALAARIENLAKAEVMLGERQQQLVKITAEIASLEVQVAAIPAPAAPSPAPDVDALARGLTAIEVEARAAQASVAVAEQRLVAAKEASVRLAEFQTASDAAAAELADWNRLAADLGRDGLQSAEVDSAGPELTALTNDLLHNCHGPQFTVSIETSRLAADGKSEVEECRVQVIDSVDGREGEAREFSGGQSVIIGEAISLALTMLACRRLGTTGITLVRDESGAALDPVAGRAYIKMLRRAADFVGASRVLVVTHNQECADMCDARILIQDGKVSYQ